ncbi:DUF6998 domain-containing protein [Pseudomonas azotoformans]|uniref:DUF6998 domain-containing protein n=1 Tax=Pseudomonas azotoformans TaxID=47878 RepID=UPI00122DDBE1|nr:hypothetical protein [Pseudomonas azotoformans]UMY49291.1 hypothetical protein MLC69_29105 [Pseudomonas azotoformans]
MTLDQESALAAFFKAVDRLEEVGVIRSSRFLGDIGEFLCADAFGTVLVEELRQPGHDGVHDEKRVQIKFNNSPTGNNINLGNPEKYDEVVVVIGPRSKLRESEHQPGEFRFYRFSSSEVRPWRTGNNNFYCAKERIVNCTNKHVIRSGEGAGVL